MRNPDRAITTRTIISMSRMGKMSSFRRAQVYSYPVKTVNQLFDDFAVQGNIQALALLFLRYAQSHGHIDNLQDDEARHKAVNDRCRHAFELNQHRAVYT